MIYPNNFEQKVGFDQIRILLKEKCLSPLGEEKVDEMTFGACFHEVKEELEKTHELLCVIRQAQNFPVQYFFDVRPSLKRIRIEGLYLDEQELFDLRRSLETIRDIVCFFVKEDGENGTPLYPRLKALAADIEVFSPCIKRINSILSPYGRLKDNASPQLAQIRKELSQTTSSISRVLTSILRNAQLDGVVEKDATPTMRDGRLVIPVVPALKRKIKGIVHDESASGKTVFIEPAEVVETNNRIRELEYEEHREIIRILTEFSNELRPLVPDMLLSYTFLAEIDFLHAKALLAEATGSVLPSFEDRQYMDWCEAVHPLLRFSLEKQGKSVVPLDLELNDKQRIVIISGPNAGGKSVCLKTVGLLQYMLQCGLLIPVKECSHMGVFRSIFIDIGDEQSIEDDLSTYSSHLTNMKVMLKQSDKQSLILIDEFGGGTEPQIGGAIAEAILRRMNDKQVFGIITTHYQNLKHFAEDHEGVVNGAMLYDRHQMRALFQLQIGNPGSSFAVEIARKIGLPEEVISDASELVGSEYINADKYLQDIVRDKRYWETKRQQVRQKEKQLEEIITRYQHEMEEISHQRKDILVQAKEQAQQLMSEVNARIENTIRSIKEAQAEKERTRQIRQELASFQDKVQEIEESQTNEAIERKMRQLIERKKRKENRQKNNAHTHESKPRSDQQNPAGTELKPTFKVNDTVKLKGQTSVGTILEINNKQALVAFGMLKTQVALDRLTHTTAKAKDEGIATRSTFVSTQTQDSIHEKRLNFKQDIDVRGMRGDEAIQAVTYFIDDAILVGMPRVRILHGTGSGILRTLIRQYLKTVPGVSHFADEHVQFGGAGITVVDLNG